MPDRSAFSERVRQMLLDERLSPPVARTVGFRVAEAADGRAVFVLDARMDRHANPMGTLHGGILCDVADAAMGTAYGTLLESGESFTTLELKINFLRPVLSDATLTATARVVQRGRTVGLTECDVTDERGRLIARATSTCLTLRGDQAAGR
jgi:uncharacterized protein (TIGR00369 family)